MYSCLHTHLHMKMGRMIERNLSSSRERVGGLAAFLGGGNLIKNSIAAYRGNLSHECKFCLQIFWVVSSSYMLIVSFEKLWMHFLSFPTTHFSRRHIFVSIVWNEMETFSCTQFLFCDRIVDVKSSERLLIDNKTVNCENRSTVVSEGRHVLDPINTMILGGARRGVRGWRGKRERE